MLHANGPATLKTLRQAGCSSLETIETMEEERLSKVLGAPAAAARRFAREARHLRERLGQGILDREESLGDPLAPLLAPTAFSGRPSGTLAPEAPHPVEDRSPSVMPWASADAVEEALAAWRSLDLQELSQADAGVSLAAAEEDPSSRPARARPEFEFGSELAAAMREIATPDVLTEPIPPETHLEAPHSGESDRKCGLNPGEVDGLDEELCRTFASAGILVLEDLARADPLELSRDLGLGYTRIWRVTSLARRALARGEESADRTSEAGAAQFPHPASPGAGPQPVKMSLSGFPYREQPSILDLEWNREIRPVPPPADHGAPDGLGVLGRAEPESLGSRATELSAPETERESAGGPFA
jgi:hypothetical protein